MQTFNLTATGYNINYLPQYIAQRHGFFAKQNLNVVTTIPTPWDGVLDALADDSAHMALGGIWVPSMYRDRVPHNYTVFAQIANRCPLALLRRTNRAQKFDIKKDVVGKTVLMKGIGGASAGLWFKTLLREYGVDPRDVDFVQDLDGLMLGTLFRGGMGDYLVTDYLSARALAEKDPNVSIAMEMVTQGEVPWSVYYRETATITPEILDMEKRFCLGLCEAIKWVMARDAAEYRDELAELFPKVPVEVAIDVVNSFRRNGMWKSPVIPREAFDRWQKGLCSARFVPEPLQYDSIVDDGPARAAQAESASQ
jgi:NitT/TauT family transport system substrate-binding protein